MVKHSERPCAFGGLSPGAELSAGLCRASLPQAPRLFWRREEKRKVTYLYQGLTLYQSLCFSVMLFKPHRVLPDRPREAQRAAVTWPNYYYNQGAEPGFQAQPSLVSFHRTLLLQIEIFFPSFLSSLLSDLRSQPVLIPGSETKSLLTGVDPKDPGNFGKHQWGCPRPRIMRLW